MDNIEYCVSASFELKGDFREQAMEKRAGFPAARQTGAISLQNLSVALR